MKGPPPQPRRAGPGRPPGPTKQGLAARQKLYKTALSLVASRGYEVTTLRDIAKKADVSVGLLYRYFPSKRAVVLALYDEQSAEYATRAAKMPPGPWRERFLFALKTSLSVLAPQRSTLAALVPVLVGDAEEGPFAPSTAFSRLRVQQVFVDAVARATDAPDPELAVSLGHLLYLLHLAVILGWLLDKSPRQRATAALMGLLEPLLPLLSMTLAFPAARAFVMSADKWVCEALFPGETA